jgi:hypothetical protein
LALGCSNATDAPAGTPVNCDGEPIRSLAPGTSTVVPVTSGGACVRLAATGGTAAEFLVLAYSANGQEQLGGAKGEFSLYIGPDTFAAPAAARHREAIASRGERTFHDRIRQRERALAEAAPRTIRRAGLHGAPVALGDRRAFQVCADPDCLSFTSVSATARYVGREGVVFLDDTVPAGGYTQAELDSVGGLFDDWLYPIDTTAFGRESDVDGNGQVLVLLTDQLNRLSGNCNVTRQLIVGYFFGLDLLDQPNSNQGEVFYGLVPDPGSPTCAVDKTLVRTLLAPVFIHEFQHMISFNRHVLLGGGTAEETWLNEGLSHFAEELGGRQIPGQYCVAQNCVNQFIRNDVTNAYDFLLKPELYYLVEPGVSFGSLAERGANWLFVRWLAEQAPGDSSLGSAVTRRLLGADVPTGIALVGEANAEAVADAVVQAGVTFKELLADWHAANYLESRTDLAPAGRLSYRSWNLPNAFSQLAFGPYPLRPDSSSGWYQGSGELRGGSGRLVRLLRPAGADPIAVGLTASQVVVARPHLSVRRIR